MAVEEDVKHTEVEGLQTGSGVLKDDRKPRILGVAEWQRVGPGWEKLWGCWSAWDPRECYLLCWSLCLRMRARNEEGSATAMSCDRIGS